MWIYIGLLFHFHILEIKLGIWHKQPTSEYTTSYIAWFPKLKAVCSPYYKQNIYLGKYIEDIYKIMTYNLQNKQIVVVHTT